LESVFILIDRILIYYFQNLFQKKLYWDVSISESEVKRHWLVKAAIKYRNFISKIKGGGVRPGVVPEHVWERWTQLWGSNESKKKSETNAKNRRGGREVAAGTHTCGSISIGEHSKKLVSIYFTNYISNIFRLSDIYTCI